MDYLRFVISHEAGHRRISRTEFIPKEEWQQQGFSFMMNAIEDPRDNNFVAESYPKFKEHMSLAYEHDLDVEEKHKQKAQQKLGYEPRFMQAGFEYIKQWFRDVQKQEIEVGEDLPPEVKEVVEKTIAEAQKSWWTYPSKKEADSAEKNITKYAKTYYEINRDRIWPEFQKLVEMDKEDQQMQEFLQDMQKQQGQEQESQIPEELDQELTEEEKQKLQEELDKSSSPEKEGEESEGGEGDNEGESEGEESSEQSSQEGKPVDLDSLPEELKEKIKKHLEELPEEKKQELEEKAEQSLKEFEKDINQELEGELNENPEQREERKEQGEEKDEDQEQQDQDKKDKERQEASAAAEEYKKKVEQIMDKENQDVYRQYRQEVLPLIKELEHKLRRIFVARRQGDWQSGYKKGKKIDIGKRMQEKAKGIPATESRSWKKRTVPTESDYAISLLVDLSGSMKKRDKIEETFKSVIVIAEVLNRLSIKTEILGFNDRLYEYKSFQQSKLEEARQKMGNMLQEVRSDRALCNDDGWALKEASQRLGDQREQEKFLLAFSDGIPEESDQHSGPEYNLSRVVQELTQKTDQKLVGLGIGQGTDHVEKYYPNHIADIPVDEMPKQLVELLKDLIENYQKFQ